MKNIYKRTMFMMGGAAASIGAIAGVISCSSSKSDIKIGIRPEEEHLWRPVISAFERDTGYKVKTKWISDQQNQYSLWNGGTLTPEITIADSNWSRTGVTKEWFQKIDLKDIITNDKWMTNSDTNKQVKLSFDDKTFSTKMLETMKNGDMFNAYAIIYGPKLNYVWKKVPLGSNRYVDLFDGTLPIDYYVPSANGTTLVKAYEGGTDSSSTADKDNSPLFSRKADRHRLMNNIEDVQEFISNSAAAAEAKFNLAKKSDGTIDYLTVYKDTTGDTTDENKKRVISTGPLGFRQRLQSVMYGIFEGKKSEWAGLSGDKPNSSIVSAYSPSWSGFVYSDDIYSKMLPTDEIELNVDDNNSLIDSKVFNPDKTKVDVYKWNVRDASGAQSAISELQARDYLAQAGYYQNGALGNSGTMDGDDAQVGFGKFKSLLIGDGALWQWGGIKAKVENRFKGESAEDLITTLGQPFQTTGVDGYAIAKWVSGSKLDIAKKFMRYIMQKDMAAKIAGTKAISTVKAAAALQPKIDGALQAGFSNAGTNGLANPAEAFKTSFEFAFSSIRNDIIEGAKVPVTPVYGTYQNFWGKTSEFNPSSGNWSISHAKYEAANRIVNGKYNDVVATDNKYGVYK